MISAAAVTFKASGVLSLGVVAVRPTTSGSVVVVDTALTLSRICPEGCYSSPKAPIHPLEELHHLLQGTVGV